MKAKILVGAIAALIYGNAAMAQDQSTTGSQDPQGQPSQEPIGGSGQDDTDSDLMILDQEDVSDVPAVPDTSMEGVGGAGSQGQSIAPQARPGIPVQGQGGMTLYCTPVQPSATGGSGELQGGASDPGSQQRLQGEPQSSLQPGYDVGSSEVGAIDEEKAVGGAGLDDRGRRQEDKNDMRGLTLTVGAGVEGYTGGLAPAINPGATVGVTASLKPSKVLGIELGYSGAINNLDADVGGTGPDIVRNGGQAALTLGLAATPVQPYVLGGFGINRINVRNGEALGFSDDTNSNVPVGLGLRAHAGSFTADARVNYNFLIGDEIAPGVDNDDLTTGSYAGTLNIGGTF